MGYNGTADNTVVDRILKAILRQKTDITAIREDWVQICSVVVNNFGEAGRQIFHAFSQYHPKYSIKETDKLYDDLLKRERYSYSVGTLVHIAREHSIRY